MVRLGIVAWYELNKDYVAKTLCENRDKPQMKCCGKCYLRKQLKKTEEGSDNSKQLPTKINKTEPAVFFAATIVRPNLYLLPEARIFHDHYKAPIGYDPVSSIFHPPSVC